MNLNAFKSIETNKNEAADGMLGKVRSFSMILAQRVLGLLTSHTDVITV